MISDDQFLDSIEEQVGRSSDSTYAFTIGETFYIILDAWQGDTGCMQPAPPEHLRDWDPCTIKLYYYDPSPPPPETEQYKFPIKASTFVQKDGMMGDWIVGDMFKRLDDITIDIDFRWFPHRNLLPLHDEPFKDQPWASQFGNHNGAVVNKATLCEILRYLQQVEPLKVFW
jgi:hypothetical protein